MGNFIDVEKMCMGCMHVKELADADCPLCGFCQSQYAQSPHQLPLRTILNGKYLVGKVLGEGGFGITYLAWDLNLGIKVAIKEYYPSGFVTRENTSANTVTAYTGTKGDFFEKGKNRFVDEARSLAKFRSMPGIVTISDFFNENGTAYIAMEYIDGQTMKAYLASMGGKLPAGQVFEMLKPVMLSLQEIHSAGLVHRDISPDNIMISRNGYVKLLDFGSATEFADSGEHSKTSMLKPGYAPEEQYRSRGILGPWTDIYALSATMYKMITGITPEEAVERVLQDRLQPPSTFGVDITPAQEAALMKGLSVLQQKRFQSMKEFLDALSANDKNDIKVIKPLVGKLINPPAPKPGEKRTKQQWPDDEVVHHKQKKTQLKSLDSIVVKNSWKKIAAIAAGIVAVCLLLVFSFYNREFVVVNGILKKYNGKATEVTVPYGVKEVVSKAFQGKSIESIVLPDSVEILNLAAFLSCSSLQSVELSSSLETIYYDTFNDCDSLQAITIPESVTTIENDAFANCDVLQDVTIPSTTSKIGSRAFSNSPKVIFVCERGSYAEQYAIENELPYRLKGAVSDFVPESTPESSSDSQSSSTPEVGLEANTNQFNLCTNTDLIDSVYGRLTDKYVDYIQKVALDEEVYLTDNYSFHVQTTGTVDDEDSNTSKLVAVFLQVQAPNPGESYWLSQEDFLLISDVLQGRDMMMPFTACDSSTDAMTDLYFPIYVNDQPQEIVLIYNAPIESSRYYVLNTNPMAYDTLYTYGWNE